MSQSLRNQGSQSDPGTVYSLESAERLNPFEIREASQTRRQNRRHPRRSQSLRNQGSQSDAGRSPVLGGGERLNPFEIREASQTLHFGKSCHHLMRLNPFEIREASQTAKNKSASSPNCLNPFEIREASQTVLKTIRTLRRVSIPSKSGKPVRPRARNCSMLTSTCKGAWRQNDGAKS